MSNREERLRSELAAIEALQAESSILDFTTENDPPDRYVISFRGLGINRGTSPDASIESIDLHRCELKLPYSYPRRPPDIRWRTPIYHPNISFSGLVKLRDVGMPWDEDLGLDIVLERLWDVARLAYVDEQRACNYSAKNWLKGQTAIALPADNRPLRDKTAPSGSNIIQYERRQPGQIELPRSTTEADDVLYIDDNTPTPEIPQTRPPSRTRNTSGDDEVFYIGDE